MTGKEKPEIEELLPPEPSSRVDDQEPRGITIENSEDIVGKEIPRTPVVADNPLPSARRSSRVRSRPQRLDL